MIQRVFKIAFLLFVCHTATTALAQTLDTGSIFSRPVQLDTFTIKSGFDVNAFIRRVKNDTSFYKAFRSMHLLPYTAKNDIRAYDKNGKVAAAEYSVSKQERTNNCRITKMQEQKITGNYYTLSGDYNYYTSALFAYLFFTTEEVCNENDIVAGNMEQHGTGTMEKSKYELKQLIFNPGSKVSGIPFMSDRASIFEPDEARKYDFRISLETYGGQPCYRFRITPHKGYEHKTLYNELTTWFRKSDYSILARDYSLSYHTLVYDFDVAMKVRTVQINDKIYPSHIDYNGNWHIFTRKRERVKFTVDITY